MTYPPDYPHKCCTECAICCACGALTPVTHTETPWDDARGGMRLITYIVTSTVIGGMLGALYVLLAWKVT